MVIKKEHILLLLLLCCVLLFSCTSTDKKIDKHSNKNVEQENKNNKNEEELLEKGYNLPVSGSEKTESENSCKEVMELVSDLYKNADKGTSLNIVIKSKVIRQMVKLLGNAGYQARCNEAYSNMENYKKFERFLKKSISGQKGSCIVYDVHTDGGIGRRKYIYNGKEMYVLAASASWDNNNKPVVTYISSSRIKNWRYSEKGWFCYEVCVPEYPEVSEMVDGSFLVRVKPINSKKRKYSKKYVFGLGYQGNNLLCSDWNASHIKDLDFNGMYEYLYKIKYKKKFNPEKYPDGIPKEEFEKLVMEYIPVTAGSIQKYAVFNKKKQAYLWTGLGCFNYAPSSFATSIPEVTDTRKNKDGTITLTVDAVCETVLCNEAVITHELTIKLSDNGSFTYIGNKILHNGIKEIPSYQYRINKKNKRTEMPVSIQRDYKKQGTEVQYSGNGKLEFAFTIEDFINIYNEYYHNDNSSIYIYPCEEWYSYIQDFGKYKGMVHYEFTADKEIWTLPSITIYTKENRKEILELTVNFDDHSYTKKMYKQYEELCYYTLKVFFPGWTKKKIIKSYKDINKLAYKNIFPNKKGFDSGNPPIDLYYQGKIGVYPYFAYGERVRLCIIPVTAKVVELYKKNGTLVHKIQ